MQNNQTSGYPAEGSREMMDAGVFYGRKKSKTNPKMRAFVLANRGGIEIINLQKTEEMMDAAAAFIKERVRNNGLVLLVGTEPGGGNEHHGARKEVQHPVCHDPLGRRRDHELQDHLQARGTSEDASHRPRVRRARNKYTKKERLEMEREMSAWKRSWAAWKI